MKALALLPFLFLAAACSGKVVIGENASNQGSLKKNPDGSSTGNGQTCTYDGKTVSVGQTFSLDGCNTCKCAPEGAYCTEMACASDGGAGEAGSGCVDNGKTYVKGETWTCSDGCNTCSCTGDGMVASTMMACITNCAAPGACTGPAPGMPNWTCADGTTGGPVCSDTGAGQCGWVIRDCTCSVNGKTYKPGEQYTTACNTCQCEQSGTSICTAKACSCPPDGTVIDCEPPIDQKPQCSGPEHDWIVANCPKVTFAL